MSCKHFALAVLAVACSVANLSADVTGTILGTVRDASHAVVPGATITATNTATNFTREATSDSAGEFRLIALPAGPYRVTATANGFDQFVATDIDLKVNDQLRINTTLKIGTVKEAVTVEANSVQMKRKVRNLDKL